VVAGFARIQFSTSRSNLNSGEFSYGDGGIALW
jgi:hypothetical protein